MKISKFATGFTVAAFAALTFVAASATEPLLSPRAKSAASVQSTGPEADHIDRGLPTASPKALANQAGLARTAGGSADAMAACHTMKAAASKMDCAKPQDCCAMPCCKS